MNTINIQPIRTVAALLLASMAFGQTATSTLTGTVIDPSGAAVANAEITLTNRAQLQKRSVLSSHDGSFVFPLLSPGAYDAEVQKPGFAITTVKGIELEVIPNRQHNVPSHPFFIRKKWDFFVRHLLDEEPPADFHLDIAIQP